MGYEMGFAKKHSEDECSIDDVVWFSCGWDLVDLYQGLCDACKIETDGFGEYEVDLRELAFLEKLGRRLRSQHLNDIIGMLGDLDGDYADELVASLPGSVLAAMRLAYVLPDESTGAQRRVCSLLCNLEENGYRGMSLRMANAVKRMRIEGMETCILFAG